MSAELDVNNSVGSRQLQSSLLSTSENSYRRILIFISPPGTISDAMTAAIEREFSWVSVINVPEPQMACAKFNSDVQLVIVDHHLLTDFHNHREKLTEMHPGANTAIMAATQPDHDHCEKLIDIIEHQAICGILPENVNLDIWLSIIRIMLKGGEYFPHALFQPIHSFEGTNRSVLKDRHAHGLGQLEQWSTTMTELTDREVEILAMVAQGHQNKIIAFKLGLSEHTVKIHLHHIIQKLGVHNRTEATAQYFKHIHLFKEAGTNDEVDLEEEHHDGRQADQAGKRPPTSRD